MIKPYTWQEKLIRQANDILRKRDFLHNASSTGTGKTVCSLQTVKDLSLTPLVIAPKSVHTAWRRTAAEMEAPIRGVINAEKLQYANPYYGKGAWHIDGYDLVIWDECHKGASGVKSKTTRILGELKAYPLKVMTLSATLADSPLKLRAVGYLANLHQFNNDSYMRWCLKHSCFKMPGVRTLKFHTGPKGQEAIRAIAKDMAPYMVRINSDDVPEFPESMILCDLYDLSERDTAEFNRIMAEMDAQLKQTTHANPLTEMLRARQRTELLKVPLLVELARDALEEGLAPVFFVNFRDTIEALAAETRALGITSSWIWGNQNSRERDNEIDRFQKDNTDMMIATIAAGGVGISLHALKDSSLRNRTSFITPNFSASEFQQALGRIHRAGGHNVAQHVVLAANTIEERIHTAIRGKLNRISTINDGDLGAPKP